MHCVSLLRSQQKLLVHVTASKYWSNGGITNSASVAGPVDGVFTLDGGAVQVDGVGPFVEAAGPGDGLGPAEAGAA